jgi:hypothetical protein
MQHSTPLRDIEITGSFSRDGYPALSAWIARDPDNESFIFRKFDKLAARNLLHLQSRVIALEDELEKLDAETRGSRDLDLKQSNRRWETFTKNALDPDRADKEGKRMKLYGEIQVKIKEYRKPPIELWC